MSPRGHFEHGATVRAPIDEVFAYLDDHLRLSAHMGRSSWMMGGGRMSIELDEHRGQRVGSCIRLAGRAFGMRLFIDYALPQAGPARWLGMAFGRSYAKWCTRSMLDDAVAHFASSTGGSGVPETHNGAAQ